MELVSFLTLLVGLASLVWSARARWNDRMTPYWSLGGSAFFFGVVENSFYDARSLAVSAIRNSYDEEVDPNELFFYVLHCEGVFSASRVRFGITEGFRFAVFKINPDGTFGHAMHLESEHHTVLIPGERLMVAVLPAKGVPVVSGFLYVRWRRYGSGRDVDDVYALCLNLGRDIKLSWHGRRQLLKTGASPKNAFLFED